MSLQTNRIWRAGALVAAMQLAGCASEKLFSSKFDGTPSGQPPAHNQAIGTANILGSPGSVIVVDPPVQPSGKWVRISRANQATVSVFQGNFTQPRGDGTYTFTATLFIPAGPGVPTVQFENFGQPVQDLGGFLHLDFTQANQVRIDDDDTTAFGSFERNKPFLVQVMLNITAPTATARIVLGGDGASGEADYNVHPSFPPKALDFGAVRLWMGSPHLGHFDATNIVVERK